MQSIKRVFTFEAAHRLLNYEGKCANLHGHSYKLEVVAESTDGRLDKNGFVVDFAEIKTIINPIIERADHNSFWHSEDPLLKYFDQACSLHYPVHKEPIVFNMHNPSAENIAAWLLALAIQQEYSSAWRFAGFVLHETEKCSVLLGRQAAIEYAERNNIPLRKGLQPK